MSRVSVPRGLVATGLILVAVVLAACTPSPDDGGSTTTTSSAPTTTTTPTTQPADGTTPTITDAEYAQSGVRLRFVAPSVTPGPVNNYLYDVSCDGGLTTLVTGQYVGTTSSPAIVFTTCGDGAVSSYRISAVYSGSTSAPSAWKTVDQLSAPSLNDVQYASGGIALHFTAPSVAADESVTNYVYDVTCDGGLTNLATAAFLATTHSPAIAGNFCPDGTPSRYRLAAIVDSSWTSPYTTWRTADPLTAPGLTAATLTPTGAKLTIAAPTVGSDESITDYRYDLSCDGGSTTHMAAQYVGSTSNPATVTQRCSSPGTSSYRVAAVISSMWTTPYSLWSLAT